MKASLEEKTKIKSFLRREDQDKKASLEEKTKIKSFLKEEKYQDEKVL